MSNRPTGLTRASQKFLYTAKFRKNFKGMSWKYIGKRLSHFQYWRCKLPIYFQHIPINFYVIGKMYGFFTGSGEARWAMPTYPQKHETI